MPLYNFVCEHCNHTTEEIMGWWEMDELTQKYGEVSITCAQCGKKALKTQDIELTGNMNHTWAEQTWGKKG